MSTQDLTLFQALGAKMDYLSQRQRVLSQNVANSDTPGYKPKDLAPVDFSKTLSNVMRSKNNTVQIERTNAGHMALGGSRDLTSGRIIKQEGSFEVAPNGNAVVIEEQLIKSGENMMNYNLVSSLYRKNVGLIRTALGRGQ